jgi:WD40 repeat protein
LVPCKLLVGSNVTDGLLFVGYRDGSIRMFDVATELVVCCLMGHSRPINSLHLVSDGWLVSASDEGCAFVWNYDSRSDSTGAAGGVVHAKVEMSSGNISSPDGDSTATGVARLDATFDVNCFVMDRVGKRLFTGSSSGIVCVWDVNSGNLLKSITGPPDRSVDILYLIHQEQLLVTESGKRDLSRVKLLQVWNVDTGEIVRLQDNDLTVYCSRHFPSDDRLLTIGPVTVGAATSEIVIAIHDLVHLRTISMLHCNIYGDMDANSLRVVGFSTMASEGRVSAQQPSARKHARLSKVTRRNPPVVAGREQRAVDGDGKRTIAAEAGLFFLLNYFPPGNISYFFTFSVDSTDSLLSMERNDPFPVSVVGPQCCVLQPTGGTCICGTVTGTLIRWNLRSRKIDAELTDPSLNIPKGHDSAVATGLAHDGPVLCLLADTNCQRLLISGGKDRKVKLWSVATGELLTVLSSHSDSITCLSVSNDLNWILSASNDGLLYVWIKSSEKNAYRRRCMTHLHGLADSVSLTADHSHVVARIRSNPFGRSALLLLRTLNIP